jgi:hypothetical protein
LRVYRLLADQFRFFPMDIPAPQGTSWRALFKVVVALHDIGKSVAMEMGNKRLHHLFSTHVTDSLMKQLGFPEPQRRMARSLMNHDLIADAIRQVGSVEDSIHGLELLARENGMTGADYFRVQAFFFTIDAASYTNVRRRHFYRIGGALRPARHAIFPQLETHFFAP